MPIYEYVCHDCGHEFEKIVGWSDAIPACLACSSHNVTRQLSPPAIHFKGSGWYITDSKNGQKGSNGANGTNGNGKDGGAKESSVDSTAEAKKESSTDGDKKSTTGGESKVESKSEPSVKKEAAKSS